LILSGYSYVSRLSSELHPLSLHDALPIWVARARARPLRRERAGAVGGGPAGAAAAERARAALGRRGRGAARRGRSRLRSARRAADRKSTRLNSSHGSTSYAVFCLRKKKTK